MMLIERVFRWNGSFYTSNVNFTLHTCTWWQRMICKIVRKLWNYKSSDFKKHSLKFFAATYISKKLNSMELLHCQIFLRNKVETSSILLNNLISVDANKTLWFFFLAVQSILNFGTDISISSSQKRGNPIIARMANVPGLTFRFCFWNIFWNWCAKTKTIGNEDRTQATKL